MSILTDTIRKQFKEGDDIRDEGLTTPDTVQRFDNILYGDDPEWNTMDLYIPKEEKEKLAKYNNMLQNVKSRLDNI